MPAKHGLTIKDVKRWEGVPVCVVMKDGSSYIGYIAKVENGSVLFAGQKGCEKIDPRMLRHADRARVSGLFPGMLGNFGLGGGGLNVPGTDAGFGGLLPGTGLNDGAGGLGGLGGLMSTFKKAWPGIRMGIGMMQTILPLLGGLKI